jgi:hypothetical protein
MTKRYDDDDDPNRILRDGEHLRVPMMMRDWAEPANAGITITTHSPVTVVDDFGNSGLALQQPGYRYLHAGHRTVDHALLVTREAMRAEARADYIRRTCDAWKGGDP